MEELTSFRRFFPVAEHWAYLNHASTGPLPLPTAEAMRSSISQREWREQPDLESWDLSVTETRHLVASLLNASADEIAFVSSTSHGLNLVAAGLGWEPGDNVVCAETEFPANVYPWLNLRSRGVDVRFARASHARIPLESIAECMDQRTRLVAVSFVEFATGYRNDLAAIAALCHQLGARLCVDGIQGLGALVLDVSQCGVDFVAAHAPKWLLGPTGIGFLYCRSCRLPELARTMAGWRGVRDQKAYFGYDSEWLTDARCFETGSPNHIGIAGLGASLKFLLDVGIERIEARVLALTDYLLARLEACGYPVITPHACRGERSGIVSFVPGNEEPDAVARRLLADGVVVSARGPWIRVSPHFYNTEEEIDRLVGLLSSRRPTG